MADPSEPSEPDKVPVDRAYLKDLETERMVAQIEAKVQAKLLKRYSWIGAALTVIALFGGTAAFQTMVRSSVDEVTENVFAGAQTQTRDIVRNVRADTKSIIKEARDETKKLMRARDDAEDAVRELHKLKAQADGVILQTKTAGQNLDRELATLEPRLASFKTEIDTLSADLEASIDTERRKIEARLAPVGRDLRLTQREFIKDMALMRVSQAHNNAALSLVSDLAFRLGQVSDVDDVVDASHRIKSELSTIINEHDARLAELRQGWDFNLVLYGVGRTGQLKSINDHLEANAFLPEMWLTSSGNTSRGGVADEIAAEFGVTGADLMPYDGSIAFVETPEGRKVAERVKRTIEEVTALDMTLLPLSLNPPGQIHREAFGRSFSPEQLIVVSVLPPSRVSELAPAPGDRADAGDGSPHKQLASDQTLR
ncbi:MAG: hypothetical protein AAGJ94_01680 [Pseudomonadota bacterium]